MNKYTKMLIVGFVLWFLETAYFGFNAVAGSGAERVLDLISFAFVMWGSIGLITYEAVDYWFKEKLNYGEKVRIATLSIKKSKK